MAEWPTRRRGARQDQHQRVALPAEFTVLRIGCLYTRSRRAQNGVDLLAGAGEYTAHAKLLALRRHHVVDRLPDAHQPARRGLAIVPNVGRVGAVDVQHVANGLRGGQRRAFERRNLCVEFRRQARDMNAVGVVDGRIVLRADGFLIGLDVGLDLGRLGDGAEHIVDRRGHAVRRIRSARFHGVRDGRAGRTGLRGDAHCELLGIAAQIRHGSGGAEIGHLLADWSSGMPSRATAAVNLRGTAVPSAIVASRRVSTRMPDSAVLGTTPPISPAAICARIVRRDLRGSAASEARRGRRPHCFEDVGERATRARRQTNLGDERPAHAFAGTLDEPVGKVARSGLYHAELRHAALDRVSNLDRWRGRRK